MNTRYFPGMICIGLLALAISSYGQTLADKAIIVKLPSGEEIMYKDIRLANYEVEYFRSVFKNETDLQKAKSQSEYLHLTKEVKRILVNDNVKKFGLIASGQEIEKGVNDAIKAMYGKERFTDADANKANHEREEMISLVEKWRKDRRAGDALFREKFSKKMSPEAWEHTKKEFETQAAFEEWKQKWPIVTVDGVYKIIRKRVKEQILEKQVVEKLKLDGALAPSENLSDLVDRQLSTAEFLYPDVIAYQKKEIKKPVKDPNVVQDANVKKNILIKGPTQQ